MIERFKHGKLLWVNMKNPTPDDVQKVMKELDIPPILMTDITTVVPKNTVTRSDGFIKVTLDFPSIKHIGSDHQFEVKFLVSKSSLVTVQYEEMEGIDRFKRQFEVATSIRKTQTHLNGGHLFFSLFNNLYEAASSKLDYMETKLNDIEGQIFKNNEKHMVFEISNVGKRLIAFRHVIKNHDDVFHELAPLLEHLFEKAFGAELKNLHHQYFILQRRVDTQYETLSALRETNSAMLYTKQNEIMKIFTIMAFTTFPLTLISSIFGMNVPDMPIVSGPNGFGIVVGIMLAITACFFTFFKHKHWL